VALELVFVALELVFVALELVFVVGWHGLDLLEHVFDKAFSLVS
jgi:hypothetical protein